MSMGKKVLIGLGGLIGVLALVLFGGGALIDGKIALETEKHLSSPPDVLFRFLDNAPGIDAWWSAVEMPAGSPKMTVKRKSGPEQGEGLQVVFEADGSVMETWTLKRVTPPTSIVYDVDFAGAMVVERTLTLTPDGSGARVKWAETGNIERPAMRWMKLLMPPESIIDNFDKALGALERAAKNRAASG